MAEIRLENLTKIFDGQTVAVDHIDATFASSKLTCLLGPSGCGKTTLLRMIAGLETPTAGEIYFGDRRVTHLDPSDRDMGMVFQQPVVYPGLNVEENVEMPLKDAGIPKVERQERLDRVLTTLRLESIRDKPVEGMSIGQRQKISVARTVARETGVILFDEPITDVDVETKIQLKRSLKQIAKNLEGTIVYVTHDQTTSMTLADRITLMRNGNFVQDAPPRKLYREPSERFGGWFLGNPGMNFSNYYVTSMNGAEKLQSPLFSTPITIEGIGNRDRVMIGIRPEHIKAYPDPDSSPVQGKILRKSVYVGGQYLVIIGLGNERIKAKVSPNTGRKLEDRIGLECPLDQVVVFDEDGIRLESAQLTK